ncbi:MAG: DUF2959 family protein [Arenicella sp.]|nr:DUF2959 family protein [Arenicella sp.]
MKPFLTLLLIVSLTACGTAQKVQYSALESVGIHKREILVDRVEKTSLTQEQAKEQFQSAYEELASLIKVDDNRGLEKKYKRMANAVALSEDRANELDSRIDAVDRVAQALFEEWHAEIKEYQSAKLKSISARNLETTKKRYGVIYKQMRESHARVMPVLQVLQDNTLFLKHNLNARAVNSLSSESLIIESKVKELVRQMEASIDESTAFIKDMKSSS